MKRWIAVLILLAIISSVCTGSIIYVNHSMSKLNESMEITIAFAKKQQTDEALNQLNETRGLWQKHRTVLMMYIEQDLLDELDNQFTLLNALLLYHTEEFLPQALLCISHLEEIQQRETVTLRSWF